MKASQAAIAGTLGAGGLGGMAYGGVAIAQTIQENNKNYEKQQERKEFYRKAYVGIDNLYKANSSLEWGSSWKFGTHDSNPEMWEFIWIIEVIRGRPSNSPLPTEFTIKEKEEWEERRWKLIQSHNNLIEISTERKNQISQEYSNYWERFRESCLWLSAKFDDVTKAAAVNPNNDTISPCLIANDIYNWKTYDESDDVMFWYKDYLNQKKSTTGLSIGDFYWTIVNKFQRQNSKSKEQKWIDIWKKKKSQYITVNS